MSLRSNVTHYGKITKYLHWIVAILVISLLIAGFSIDLIDKSFQGTLIGLHKSTGLLLLGLMVCRIIWFIYDKKPALPTNMSRLEVILAKSMQGLLLLCILGMAVEGFVMACAAGHAPHFFGLFEVNLPIAPDKDLAKTLWNIHKTLAWVIIALVSLHALAALKHHFINKDDVLKKIL
jgi:cytochrome b561